MFRTPKITPLPKLHVHRCQRRCLHAALHQVMPGGHVAQYMCETLHQLHIKLPEQCGASERAVDGAVDGAVALAMHAATHTPAAA